MSTDLTLLRGDAGTPLTAQNLQAAALQVSATSPLQMRVGETGDIRLRIQLREDDDSCAAIRIRFSNGGRSLSGSARGPGSTLLYWCFYRLANVLNATVKDPQAERSAAAPNPVALEREAIKVVLEHEAAVASERAYDGGDEDEPPESTGFVALLTELASDGIIALASGQGADVLCEQLRRFERLRSDPVALYEALLDAKEVEDVFVSESEFIAIIRERSDR